MAYVMHYRHQSQAVVQWKNMRRILPRHMSSTLFDLLLSDTPEFKKAVAILALRSLPQLIERNAGRGRLYLNIGHSGLDQPGLAEWFKKVDVKPVFMIHDLIPITHPEYCRSGSTEKHVKRLDTMLASGFGIIGNSQATLDILANYATNGGYALPHTVSAWLGATPLPLSDAGQTDIEAPYFVTLGTIEGRKNHLLLVRLWQRLIAQYGSATPKLLIIGQRGWESEEVLSLLDTDSSLRNHVIELPRCTDTDLAHHLKGARALLFPSFVEGYGMPLVEALGHGTPVIASDLPVFRELAGEIPLYLDPTDLEGWQAAIEDYSSKTSSARHNQVRRMGNYNMPNWHEHFAKVDDWLSSIDT
ncbi:glycosyltransferase family 4 protein [Sphingobium phenoxybenzoativorans]|uniref:glycosyltransferase family 4 protein n=1 Tax=Sphingobium phenoxybenzoativorans TaxID=1592790 RepID=UPI001FE511FF|nr:glycosyltransferase family 1 protein [Sphingobium phenoxybenzoativorans]